MSPVKLYEDVAGIQLRLDRATRITDLGSA